MSFDDRVLYQSQTFTSFRLMHYICIAFWYCGSNLAYFHSYNVTLWFHRLHRHFPPDQRKTKAWEFTSHHQTMPHFVFGPYHIWIHHSSGVSKHKSIPTAHFFPAHRSTQPPTQILSGSICTNFRKKMKGIAWRWYHVVAKNIWTTLRN